MTTRPTTPTAPAATAATTALVRLGYHGSTEVAMDIVRMAGWDADAVDLREYDIADPYRTLYTGEQDTIVVKFGLDEPDLRVSATLLHDGRAVVVAEHHELAGRDSVSIEELSAYDAFERPGVLPAYLWDSVVPTRTPQGRPIHRRHRVDSMPEMMDVVATGKAVHISLASLADVAPPGIRVVPIHDLPAAPVALARVRHPEPPAHVRDFITAAEAGSAAR